MTNYFEVITDAGLDILVFSRDVAESIVLTFLKPISQLLPILTGTELGTYSLFGIMVGVGLPFYIIFTVTKYFVNIIT